MMTNVLGISASSYSIPGLIVPEVNGTWLPFNPWTPAAGDGTMPSGGTKKQPPGDRIILLLDPNDIINILGTGKEPFSPQTSPLWPDLASGWASSRQRARTKGHPPRISSSLNPSGKVTPRQVTNKFVTVRSVMTKCTRDHPP